MMGYMTSICLIDGPSSPCGVVRDLSPQLNDSRDTEIVNVIRSS